MGVWTKRLHGHHFDYRADLFLVSSSSYPLYHLLSRSDVINIPATVQLSPPTSIRSPLHRLGVIGTSERHAELACHEKAVDIDAGANEPSDTKEDSGDEDDTVKRVFPQRRLSS